MEKFRTICSQISDCIPSSYQWQWDERFDTALVVMKKEDMESLLPTVSHAYDQQWDNATVNGASDFIRSLASSLAGVSLGQLLFTSQNEAGLILFAAWWPWGDGRTTSLRIGIFSTEDDALDRDNKKEHLTAWCNF